MFINLIEKIGKYTTSNITKFGEAITFALKGLINCFLPPFYPRLILKQIMQIGFRRSFGTSKLFRLLTLQR